MNKHAHGNISLCWLNQHTSVHWVNENSCLLQIHLPDNDDNDASQTLLNANKEIAQWTSLLVQHTPDWLENYTPAYTSLLIEYCAQQADKFLVTGFLKLIASGMSSNPSSSIGDPTGTQAKDHVIDVCYSAYLCDVAGGNSGSSVTQLLEKSKQLSALTESSAKDLLANDLDKVSEHTGLSIERIVTLHTQNKYRIFTVGFLPNFAYMGLTHPDIAMPRLKKPRMRVPARAVAIADNQTAIYPQVSPGGWHILGYTPTDVSLHGILKFQAGDMVRFNPISEAAYYQQLLSSGLSA